MSENEKEPATLQLPKEVQEGLLKFLAEIPAKPYSDNRKALQVAIDMVTTPSSFKNGLYVRLESDYHAGKGWTREERKMSVEISPGKVTMRRCHAGLFSGSFRFNHIYPYIFPDDNCHEADFRKVMDDLSRLFQEDCSEELPEFNSQCRFLKNYTITTNIKLKKEPEGEVKHGQENNRREHVLGGQEREGDSGVHDDQQERKEPEGSAMGEASLGLRERPAEGSAGVKDERKRPEREGGGNDSVVDRGVGSGDVSHERSGVDSGTSGTDARRDRAGESGGSAGLGSNQLSQPNHERSVKPSIKDKSFGANNTPVRGKQSTLGTSIPGGKADPDGGVLITRPDGASGAPKMPSGNVPEDRKILTFHLTEGTNSDFIMSYVKAGTFQMGNDERNAKKTETPHQVILTDDYWIGTTAVTQRQYKRVTGYAPPFFHKGSTYPVVHVTWMDALNFCKKLNTLLSSQLPDGYEFRLPTEAEWEYAARGGKKSRHFRYSGNNNIDKVAWYHKGFDDRIQHAASRKPNELGIFCMSGNVWEWCLDCCDWNATDGVLTDTYYRESVENPVCLTGMRRVIRGGSYTSGPGECCVSFRSCIYPGRSRCDLGFRVVLARPYVQINLNNQLEVVSARGQS